MKGCGFVVDGKVVSFFPCHQCLLEGDCEEYREREGLEVVEVPLEGEVEAPVDVEVRDESEV